MGKEEKVNKDNIEKIENEISQKKKQLEYFEKTIEDVKEDPNWFTNNTLTKEQHTEWREYCLKLMKKHLARKHRLEYEFGMFDLMYGLKVIDGSND